MNTRIKTYLPAFIILVLLLVEIPCHNWIDQFREKKEIIQINPFETLPPTEYLAEYISTIILGGFKPFIVDYLWIKADKLREDKQYYEVRALLSLIARLQPRLAQVWTFNAWNMAYNISRQELDPTLRWRWVKEALRYLEEGHRHNPASYKLTSDLAFIYYHRIPQEQELMEWCLKDEGAGCYALAAKWYDRSVRVAKEKGKKYDYQVMWIYARFRHSFELLKPGDFDEAIIELEDISAFCRDYLTTAYTYRDKSVIERWIREAQDFLDIRDIFDQERILFTHKVNKESVQYWIQLAKVLNQYKELMHPRIGLDFKPLNKRVEILLLEYLRQGYVLIDQHKYQEALDEIHALEKHTQEMIPQDPPNHPARYFYEGLTQRFKELSPIIETEAKLLANYHSRNPETAQYLNKTLDLYKSYLKKQGDLKWFNLDYETKRVESLKQLLKK